MIFDYVKTSFFTEQIQIDDIGNCAIRAEDSDGAFHYMLVATKFGITRIIKFGPHVPDITILAKGFNLSYSMFKWSEKKLSKEIEQFVNDPFRKIIDAKTILLEEALQDAPGKEYWEATLRQ